MVRVYTGLRGLGLRRSHSPGLRIERGVLTVIGDGVDDMRMGACMAGTVQSHATTGLGYVVRYGAETAQWTVCALCVCVCCIVWYDVRR